jgi:hypothetical protein
MKFGLVSKLGNLIPQESLQEILNRDKENYGTAVQAQNLGAEMGPSTILLQA